MSHAEVKAVVEQVIRVRKLQLVCAILAALVVGFVGGGALALSPDPQR